MTRTVKIAEAKAHFSQIINEVREGGEVLIANGKNPVARLSAINDRQFRLAAIEALRALRSRAGSATKAEINDWKQEGRR